MLRFPPPLKCPRRHHHLQPLHTFLLLSQRTCSPHNHFPRIQIHFFPNSHPSEPVSPSLFVVPGENAHVSSSHSRSIISVRHACEQSTQSIHGKHIRCSSCRTQLVLLPSNRTLLNNHPHSNYRINSANRAPIPPIHFSDTPPPLERCPRQHIRFKHPFSFILFSLLSHANLLFHLSPPSNVHTVTLPRAVPSLHITNQTHTHPIDSCTSSPINSFSCLFFVFLWSYKRRQ